MSRWQHAQIVERFLLAPDVLGLKLRVSSPWQFLPGQYCDVRLLEGDVSRAYSIASARGEVLVELGIRVYADGALSPHLASLSSGDEVEVRGPLGGYFAFTQPQTEPIILLAGGVGLVPLMSFIRSHAAEFKAPVRLLVSHRSLEQSIYRDELLRLTDTNSHFGFWEVLTRQGTGAHRITKEDLAQQLLGLEVVKVRGYLCGPTEFVQTMHQFLTELGVKADRLRLEFIVPA